jgi:hypothetical protein
MHRVYREELAAYRPTEAYEPREYWFDAGPSRNTADVKTPLYDVLHMRVGPPIPPGCLQAPAR